MSSSRAADQLLRVVASPSPTIRSSCSLPACARALAALSSWKCELALAREAIEKTQSSEKSPSIHGSKDAFGTECTLEGGDLVADEGQLLD